MKSIQITSGNFSKQIQYKKDKEAEEKSKFHILLTHFPYIELISQWDLIIGYMKFIKQFYASVFPYQTEQLVKCRDGDGENPVLLFECN